MVVVRDAICATPIICLPHSEKRSLPIARGASMSSASG